MVVVTRKSEGVEEEEWDERRHLSPARPVTSLVVLDWAGGACGKRPTDTVTGERQRASVRAGGDRGGVEGPGQPVAGGPWTPPGGGPDAPESTPQGALAPAPAPAGGRYHQVPSLGRPQDVR